jgi:molybdate transport system ATP-binding protein
MIALDNVTLRVRDRFLLHNTDWMIKAGQQWAVLGPNGAGKSTLVKALFNEVAVVKGRLTRHGEVSTPDAIGYVSFELQQDLIASDEFKDEARFFSGSEESGTTVNQMLQSSIRYHPKEMDQLAAEFNIEYLLNRKLRALSNGEIRKVLLARALLKRPRLLILDEPFDGLDSDAKGHLHCLINRLIKKQLQVILVSHRLEEIPALISHVLFIKDGFIQYNGTKQNYDSSRRCYHNKQLHTGVSKRPNTPISDRLYPENKKEHASIIKMVDVTVKYGKVCLLNKLNWSVKAGENWAIAGPNGSGKTTLLRLVAGDHPQAYANEIYLFARRRGRGESIWEIKQRIGIVSSEFHIAYRKQIKTFEVVLSGFFDSVGLYRHASRKQQHTASDWLKILGLTDLKEKPFNQLSYGQQQMILLARAIVKSPELLILDEPCQGLDPSNRKLILDLIDYVGRNSLTQILLVTHHIKEIPNFISNILHLDHHRTAQIKRHSR